jgi:hypothetical protein
MTGFASASRVKPTTGCLYCVYKELRRLKAVMRMRSRIQELTRKFREDRDPLLAAAACTHREDRVAFGANYGGIFFGFAKLLFLVSLRHFILSDSPVSHRTDRRQSLECQVMQSRFSCHGSHHQTRETSARARHPQRTFNVRWIRKGFGSSVL